MNKKRKKFIFFFLVTFLVLIGSSGCKNNTETSAPFSGLLVKYEGCKQSTAAANGAKEVRSANADDCLEFNYDGTGMLTLKHVNCGFNCCPGTITADIACNGNQITIIEKESGQGCHCSCLFDLFYELKNVSPGSYIIRIIEPYINENETAIAFTLELFAAKSGTFCVERNHYPW